MNSIMCGELVEWIYMRQLVGHFLVRQDGMVCLPKKSSYGLDVTKIDVHGVQLGYDRYRE